jgi:hypothetical protein
MACVRALGAVAVADGAVEHRGQRLHAGATPGDALMVLEAGEPLNPEFGIDVSGDLAHAAPVAATAADVDYPEAGHRLALHPAELGADDLVAGAHREQDGAAADGLGQSAVSAQAARGQDLRQVLTAAHQVDVTVGRYPLVGVDLSDLDTDAAQSGAAGEHEQVPPVAVGAEQVRIDPDQAQC